MSNKCDRCFYKTGWEDDDGRYPICERMFFDFDKAKEECLKPGPCEYHLTHEEFMQIVDTFNEIPNN